MPGRVNVKFVVLLSIALIALFGVVAGGVYYVVSKSGEDYARLAQSREAEGDWEAAARSWALAVSHDQDNLEWLNAWLNAQQQIIPETALDYQEAFNRKYINVLRQIADLLRTDVEAHDLYLSEQRLRASGGFNAENEEFFITDVGRVLGYFAAEPEDGDWNQLRSYRGNAIARLITNRVEQTPEREQLALEDLEAAIRVNPDDPDAFSSLVSLHQFRAESARRGRDFETEAAEYALAEAEIERYKQASPGSPLGEAIGLRLALAREVNRLNREVDADQLPAAQLALREELKPALDDLLSLSLESGQVNLQSASIIINLIAGIDVTRLATDGQAIWRAAYEADPEDVAAAFSLAEFLRQTGSRAESMDLFAEIAARPNPKVSAAGLLLFGYRNEAAYRQAVVALERWETAATEDEKAEMMTLARSLNEKLLESRAETEPQMLLLAAKFAVADNDFNLADRKLRQFNDATGSANAEALRLTGVVAQRQGNPGAARDAYRQALVIEPNSIFTQVALAEVEQSLGRTGTAVALLQTVLEQQPMNDRVRERLNQLLILQGALESDDPRVNLIVQIESARRGGNTSRYIELLEQGAETYPDAPEFVSSLARAYMSQGRRDEASEAVGRALALAPEDEVIQRLAALINAEDPVERGASEIDNDSSLSETEKAIRKYRLYRSVGDLEQAYAALETAAELSPNDPQVLEFAFDREISENDAEGARALLPRIREADLDGAGGRTHEARIFLINGELQQAENLVRAALDQGSTNAGSYRLLGQILEALGRNSPALDAYQQAYTIRPNDITLLNAYLDALIRQRQLPRALEIARGALDLARNNAAFRERWLVLEGEVGDRERAFEERVKISEASPENVANNRQIIALLMDLGRYDEARGLIDTTRADADSFAMVALDARWHADRDDLNSARAVFVDYLVENDADLEGPEPYLAFAQFLIDRRDVAGGLAAAQQAIRYQDYNEFTSQLFIGMQLFQMGSNADAARVYQSIVEGMEGLETPDERLPSVRARLAEVYVRLSQYEDARDALGGIEGDQSDDLTMKLLRADIAAGTGDPATAGSLLNEAITEAPDSTIALLKRAQFRQSQDEIDDALADLDRVLELDPLSVPALRLRATIRYAQGDAREAIEDLLAAVEAAPDNVQLRLLAIRQMIAEGRSDDAADVADTGIRRSPTDLGLKVGTGDLFAAAGSHRRANTYFQSAWDQSKTLPIGQRYIESLLDSSPPNLDLARRIANSGEVEDGSTPAQVAMLKARVEGAAGDFDEVESLVISALEELDNNPSGLSAFYESLPSVFDEQIDRAQEFVSGLTDSQLTPWSEILAARFLANQDGSRSEGISRFEQLRSETLQPLQAQFVTQALAIALIGNEQFREAEQVLRAALAETPGSPDLMNNLAFVLATELDNMTEALELAVAASEIAPDSPGVLDTLGFIQIEAGNYPEAVKTLERASSLAGTGLSSVPMRINLARAKLLSGDRRGAERLADQIEDAVESSELIRDQFGERFEKLQEELRRG